jgi:hypothetical protein
MSAAAKAIPVTLAGEQHTIRITQRAIVELEDRFGITMIEAGEKLQKGSLKTIAALLWAGLLHETPRLSFDDVLGKIDLHDLETPAKAIADAMVAAFGKGEPEGNAQPAA